MSSEYEGGSESHGRVMRTHGAPDPPVDELPAVLPTPAIIWRGDGIVVAVPSLHVFSTGMQLTIMCRLNTPQARTLEHARATSERLQQLTVNRHPITALSGNYDDRGFTHTAWIPMPSDTLASNSGLTFELDWPEVAPARIHVGGVSEAAARVVRLWTE